MSTTEQINLTVGIIRDETIVNQFEIAQFISSTKEE